MRNDGPIVPQPNEGKGAVMFLFCLLLMTQPKVSSISIDAIYKPLSASKVGMSSTGHWYVLDSTNKQVLHFDPHGQALPPIAREGNGPGELKLPGGISIFGDALWVTDYYQGTQVFGLDGKFLYSRKINHPFALPEPIANGWVYEVSDAQKGITELFWANPDLEDEKSLLAFDVPDQEMFFQLGQGSLKVTFRPGQELPTWHLDPSREKLFVFIPGSGELVVVDLLTQEITGHFPIPFERQPMNTGWAKQEARNLEKRILLNGKKSPLDMDTKIPDTFPIISDFIVGPEGKIWLFDGPSLMDSHHFAELLTTSGKPTSSDFPHAEVERIVATQGDQVWFISFDGEKEIPILRRCHRRDLANQMAKYPNRRQGEGLPPLNITTQ